MQKSRLIEKLAELVNEKKLPLLADVRDESTEDVRIVLEPRARTVDAGVMMESLFRMSELESRFAMNMNVLADGVVPKVLSLPEALRQWLDHRRDVLLRRTRHRLAEIERRLEVLAGMIIVFLNLDEVIRIIREEDEPKDVLKATFELTDNQANYILDTRLRSLRRLEEMQLREEHAELTREKGELELLVGEEPRQWKAITAQIRETKKKFGPAHCARQAPHHVRGAAGGLGKLRSHRRAGRARAHYRGCHPKRLDPCAERAGVRPRQPAIQGRRRFARVVLRGNHVEDPGVRHGRQGFHAGGVEIAGRARRGRADPAAGGNRRRRGCRGGVRPSSRTKDACGVE